MYRSPTLTFCENRRPEAVSEGWKLHRPADIVQNFCVLSRISGAYALADYFSAVNNLGPLAKLLLYEPDQEYHV